MPFTIQAVLKDLKTMPQVHDIRNCMRKTIASPPDYLIHTAMPVELLFCVLITKKFKLAFGTNFNLIKLRFKSLLVVI